MLRTEPLRLLLVEDEALIAMDLEAMIEDMGYCVIGPAASVDQALTILGDLPIPPDAAIVDANLGGSSARPVVEALQTANVPTVIASGYEASELEGMGLKSLFLRKPYNAETVETALHHALNGIELAPGQEL
ncbi:response regulator [Cereibacter sp. SYSU M97828]|nr:response regulator [Cereibacter flavus]